MEKHSKFLHLLDFHACFDYCSRDDSKFLSLLEKTFCIDDKVKYNQRKSKKHSHLSIPGQLSSNYGSP